MRQSGYGFVHFPGTEEGIRSAFIAAQRLMDTEIDNVNYKCKISHHLEQHLVPPVVQQKPIYHPSVPSSLHRTVEINRSVQMGQPHSILMDNHQMYHQPHQPTLMHQPNYPTSFPLPVSARDEVGNITVHSSSRMRHEQFRLHPTTKLDLPTNPERIPNAMSNNMRQGFVSQPPYTKANQFQHPAISGHPFNPNSSVGLMNSNLSTGGTSLDLLDHNFNRVTVEQSAMVPPYIAQSTGRPNTLTHDLLGSSSTTSSISSILREHNGDTIRSSSYPQFETNHSVALNTFNFVQKTPSTAENRLFADRNNT